MDDTVIIGPLLLLLMLYVHLGNVLIQVNVSTAPRECEFYDGTYFYIKVDKNYKHPSHES